MSDTPEAFVPIADLARTLGIPVRTLHRRCLREGIRVYRDGKDRRVRLVTAEDAATLTTPAPVERDQRAA